MEQLLNLYNKAKRLNNDQLRKLFRSGDYKGLPPRWGYKCW
ncbi:hypothetical protein N8311_00350 [bacterium]|nr:hypothetical protein [bacterium]